MSKCIVSRKVRIPKTCVSKEKIEKDLILTDKRSEFASRDSFVCFKELERNYIVPKMYGTNLIRELGLPFVDIQRDGDDVDIRFTGSLREPQINVVQSTIDALTEIEGGVMSLYCGFGKTTCSLNISCHFKKKTLILVHTSSLAEQWKERIEQFVENSSVGKLQGNIIDTDDKTHVIGMMQSICKRDYPPDILNSFGMIIVDECHHIAAETFSKCIEKVGCKLRLGLSATLKRNDGMSPFIYSALGPVCAHVDREKEEVLVDIVKIENGPNDIVLMYRKGKQSPNTARMITNLCIEGEQRAEFRTSVIIRAIQKAHDKGRHIIVLSGRREHLKWIGKLLDDLDISNGLMIGGIKPDKIEEVSKSRVVLATYSFASEGLDIPSLDTLFFVTPMSETTQCVGRILRYCPGKQTPMIVDFVDECSVFLGQAKKRERYYKKLGSTVFRLDENLEIQKQVSKKCRQTLLEGFQFELDD